MMQLKRFLKDVQAQDLIEYSLILAFVALASAGLFINAGGSVSGIWGAANTALTGNDPCAPYGGYTVSINPNGSHECSN
jgi:Flp pilus assembly pilin Flp